jgi:hypothetical protein
MRHLIMSAFFKAMKIFQFKKWRAALNRTSSLRNSPADEAIIDRLASGGMIVWVVLIILFSISFGMGWFVDTEGSGCALLMLYPFLLMFVIITRFWTWTWRAVGEFFVAVPEFFEELFKVLLKGLGVLFGVVALVLFLLLAAPALFPESEFAYLIHNSFMGSRPAGTYEFFIINKPHDCDFMSAPLGRKNCHYEKDVSEPFDVTEGVSNADAERQYRVIVSWNRIED